MSRRTVFARIASALLVAILAFGGVLFSQDRAAADSFGGSCVYLETLCRADNSNMDYCTAYPWPTGYGYPFADSMSNLDNQTDMYDTYSSTCGPQTDIGGYLNSSPEWTLGASSLGIAICTKPIGNWGSGVCDQGSMIINSSLLNTYLKVRKTTCHEVGHFAGLHHDTGEGGCMVSGYSSNVAYAVPHHVGHINFWY